MVSLLSALLISIVAPAEALELQHVQYFLPNSLPSCGLLHQRDLERQKVMREMEHMMKALKTDERALVPLSCLLTNKLFMPKDTWADDAVEVSVSVRMSDEMKAEMDQIGLENVFIRTDGPGFVWQSLAGQLPEEVSILRDQDHLDIRYKTYLNATCERPLREPTVEWIPQTSLHDVINSWDVIAKVSGFRLKLSSKGLDQDPLKIGESQPSSF